MDGTQPIENEDNPCSLDDSDENMLVNPCIDNPGDFFDFEDEWIVCLNGRAKRTLDVCGLNREDLRDDRREWLIIVEAIASMFLFFDKCRDEEKRKEYAAKLAPYLRSSSKYSAMIRSKLVALGIDIEESL